MIEIKTNFTVLHSPLEIKLEEINVFQKGEGTGSILVELKCEQVAQTKRQADRTITRCGAFPIEFNKLFLDGIIGLITASDAAALASAGGQKAQGQENAGDKK